MKRYSKVLAAILSIALVVSSAFAGDAFAKQQGGKQRKNIVKRNAQFINGVHEGIADGHGNTYANYSKIKVQANKITSIDVYTDRFLEEGDSPSYVIPKADQKEIYNNVKRIITEKIVDSQNVSYSKDEAKALVKDYIENYKKKYSKEDFKTQAESMAYSDAYGIAKATEYGALAPVDDADTVYINQKYGDDEKDGKTAENAVKTFPKASELLANGGRIIIAHTYTVKDRETLDLKSKDADKRLKVVRMPGFDKDMFKARGNVTVENIDLRGNQIDSNDPDKYPQNTARASVISVSDDARCTVKKGATIEDSKSYMSPLYLSAGGKLVLDGGIIQNNVTLGHGGAITNDDGKFEINSGEIKNNTAEAVKKPNGEYENATGRGGAIYNISSSGAISKIAGGKISNNKAELDGGAISCSYSRLDIIGGEISANESPKSGAISDLGHYWDLTLSLRGGKIVGNKGKEAAVKLYTSKSGSEWNVLEVAGSPVVMDNVDKDDSSKKLNIDAKNPIITSTIKDAKLHFNNPDVELFGNDSDIKKAGDRIIENYKVVQEDDRGVSSDAGLTALAQVLSNKVSFMPAQDDGIGITDPRLTLKIGEEKKIEAYSIPRIPDEKIIYTSDNDKVAKIDETGLIKAVGKGVAVITATNSQGKNAKCRVTVVKPGFPQNLKEGVYTGKSKDGKMSVRVNVTKEHKVESIKLIKHEPLTGTQQAMIGITIDAIIKQQSTDIEPDSVVNPLGYKVIEAVEDALSGSPYIPVPLKVAYVDPKNGNDAGFGNTKEEAVKTIEAALELLKKDENASIKTLGTFEVSGEKLKIDAAKRTAPVSIMRDESFTGSIFKVTSGGLSIGDKVVIDGDSKEADSIINVAQDSNKKDFRVELLKGAAIKNVYSKDAKGSIIHSDNKNCIVNLKGANITDNSAEAGSLFNIDNGELYMSGGKIMNNTTKLGVISAADNATVAFSGTAAVYNNISLNKSKLNINLKKAGLSGALKTTKEGKANLHFTNKNVVITGVAEDKFTGDIYKLSKKDLDYIYSDEKGLAPKIKKAGKELQIVFAKKTKNPLAGKAPKMKLIKKTKKMAKIKLWKLKGAKVIKIYMRINKSKKLKLVKTIKLKKANTYTITIKLGKKAKYTIFGIAFNGKNKSKASKQIKIKI